MTTTPRQRSINPMRSETEIWIDAPPEAVFPFVAQLGRWPEWLPHYRYVRVLGARDGVTRAAMGARRGPIPVAWETIHEPEPGTRRVRFRHVGGVTCGMEVLWTLDPERGGTRARILHEFELPWPWVGRWITKHVITRQFVEPIAYRTLARFKKLAESTR